MHALAYLLLFHAICLPLASNADNLMLGCGLSDNGGEDGDGRRWSPDNKYLSGGNSITSKASVQDPSLSSEVPYMTSRVFISEASYKFPINGTKRYMLRLHFYPAVYSSFDPWNAFFSVTANEVTLLSNFSVAITCQALSQAYINREYSLAPLNSDTLTITFKPSEKHNSFAFVNGIELTEMPELFDFAPIVGYADQTLETKSLHFVTMSRLNVGGSYISPTKDSGLSRTWYDDTPYLYGGGIGVTNKVTPDVKINYKTMPQYVAPLDVYATSRSMGASKDINMGFNLTWVFQVDPDSMYLARLHFCEYYYEKINEIVFKIFINNQTAQDDADIIGWAGAKGVPTYKDYVVNGKSSGELWVALHPAPETKPEFFDALLNGLELFKLNESDLSGPNPKPSDMLAKVEEKARTFETKHDTKKTFVIGSAAGGAAGFAFVAALCVVVRNKTRKRAPGSSTTTSSWLPLYGNSNTTGTKSGSGKSVGSGNLAMAQGLCRYFSLQDMLHATQNFDESNVIGVGGFGKVYKGVIDNGFKVAIKRSNPQSEQGVNEFQTEIEMLSKLRHKHLVSLIGFCEEEDEMCLVYDYMSRGTMREHLYKGNKPLDTLTWKQRLEICIGAARGLHYLHTGAKYTIIHRDVKTTNILLDENWVAKVSDFGLSKTGPNMNQGHVSTVVKGSFGYLDPEYFRRQQLTEKSDVYSFGVVLFEALCSRPALNPSLPKEQVSLAEWVLYNKRRGTLEDIIDPNLKGQIKPESLNKFADAAEKCVSDLGLERPSMNDLLWNLEFALNLQENPNGVTKATPIEESEFEEVSLENSEMTAHYKNLSLGSEHDLSRESSSDNNAALFSQIGNQKGR